jgi:hypothetical protein
VRARSAIVLASCHTGIASHFDQPACLVGFAAQQLRSCLLTLIGEELGNIDDQMFTASTFADNVLWFEDYDNLETLSGEP